jgi:hypothetical protein
MIIIRHEGKISTPQYTEARLEAIYNVTLQSRMRFQSKMDI